MAVDILILGAGWTSAFLIPLLTSTSPPLTYSATSRTGRPGTLPFSFDPDSDDVGPFEILPDARTVLITFPILTPQAAERLVGLYGRSRKGGDKDKNFKTGFILLGTSGIWAGPRIPSPSPSQAGSPQPEPDPKPTPIWHDRHTPPSVHPRALAETAFLALSTPQTPTTVLNLAGLWGGGVGGAQRDPRDWLTRVAPTKAALRDKRSLHLLHGHDLARAILAVHADRFVQAAGQRWLVTDGRVYDWWDLAAAWGSSLDAGETETAPGSGPPHPRPCPCYARWVRELMREQGVRALPRGVGELGRALDSREFWEVFGLSPVRPLLVRE
ncbi:hypothetical protein LshimejAT787_0806330 [Lyophyllum shimeji]|uniref:Uncharacterized protein n=1 Tax=Lyophyllum shimeji TaxID=47721 RepID=A0A9P3PQF3_LYOSH|nr:hypothetical protein LshimejAT787_0806330 [Lyophyllum shimeji]